MTDQPSPMGLSLHTAVRAVRRCVRSPITVWALWLINVAVLLGLVVWIFSDGKFSLTTAFLQDRIGAVLERGAFASTYTWYTGRVYTLAVVSVLAAASFVGILLGLFFGAERHRRVRSWFAFTLLLAAWLTLFGSWQELAWHGLSFRLQNRIAGFETIAQSLRSNWPNIDGEIPGTGQYMAYPINDPTTLIMLTRPVMPHTSVSFATVERGDDGALRFELLGDGPDAWLEWHPPGSVPKSFASGIEKQYALNRFTPLADGWYLVRYENVAGTLRVP